MKSPKDIFADAMQRLGLEMQSPRIAIAVSGGGDSLALTLLMHHWATARGGQILALTVDHGLRTESRGEAKTLNALLEKRGIRHKILEWEGQKPVSHIQERAREVRYRLLLDACRRDEVAVLAVAHNMEDQIETFWMRLAAGSGLDGLSGIAPLRVIDGVSIIRPLLGYARADLRAVCQDAGVEWIDDPSNTNPKFLRVKLRQFEELLAGEGLSPQRLALVLQKLEDARLALQETTETALAAAAAFHDAGYATLERKKWSAAPADIQRRMLSCLLQGIAPQLYSAGFEGVDQARLDMLGESFSGRTLAGCEIFPGKSGEIIICREPAAAAPRASLQEGMVWDGRFLVSGYPGESPAATPLEIGILGEDGVSQLRKQIDKKAPEDTAVAALPFKVRKSLPALWRGQNLMAVPHLSWFAPGAAKALEKLRLAFLPQEQKASLPL